MVRAVGFEPTTFRLKAGYSTVELCPRLAPEGAIGGGIFNGNPEGCPLSSEGEKIESHFEPRTLKAHTNRRCASKTTAAGVKLEGSNFSIAIAFSD